MTNSELEQAQEWADKTLNNYPFPSHEGVAARLIQSLPDQWLDAEKVKAIISDMDHCLKMETTTDFSKGIDNATTTWRDALKALVTPKLPTLADMTPEECLASKFMQAKIAYSDQICVISSPGLTSSSLWMENGHVIRRDNENITPLQGEPKLKWPGSEPQPDKVSLSDMWVDDGSSPVDALKLADKYEELDRIKPEEVPADELWLVEYDNHQWVAQRNRKGSDDYPWRVASAAGDGVDIAGDSKITLIHKLVPENHTLPRGMRLADHEEYGRVVVSPKMDSDSEYKVTHTDPVDVYGTDWQYVHQSELTFLDGE